jgi:2-dehydropantoate 2-reductase
MKEITDICVYGIGGIGGAVGGLLCESAGNHKAAVSFIARGRHLDAINRDGLKLRLPDGNEITCRPHHASAKISHVPRPRLIFIAVKSFDLPAVLSEINGVAAQDTYLIPLLNGFDVYERIRKIVKNGFVFPSCVIFGGRRVDHGKNILSMPGPVFLGPDPMHKEFIPEDLFPILKSFDASPVTFKWVPDPYPMIWNKYLGNVALNLVGAYSGKVLGEILGSPDLKRLLISILHETAEVVAKRNAPLPQNAAEYALSVIEKMPYGTTSSFTVDIESNSPRNEGDIFGAAILNLARETGVAAPTIESTFLNIQKRMPS